MPPPPEPPPPLPPHPPGLWLPWWSDRVPGILVEVERHAGGAMSLEAKQPVAPEDAPRGDVRCRAQRRHRGTGGDGRRVITGKLGDGHSGAATT